MQSRLWDAGAGVLADGHRVVAVDQVADDVAEVVGEALVEGAGLARVEQPGGGLRDTVGHLVGGDVGLDEGAGQLLALEHARVAVDHLRLAQVAGEHRVAVVLRAEVDRADQRPALVVPRVPAERLPVGHDRVAVGLRGDRVGVGDRRARAHRERAGQLALVPDRRRVVGLHRAGAGGRVPGLGGGVGELDARSGPESVRRQVATEGVGPGDLDTVGVGLGAAHPAAQEGGARHRREHVRHTGRTSTRSPVVASM